MRLRNCQYYRRKPLIPLPLLFGVTVSLTFKLSYYYIHDAHENSLFCLFKNLYIQLYPCIICNLILSFNILFERLADVVTVNFVCYCDQNRGCPHICSMFLWVWQDESNI